MLSVLGCMSLRYSPVLCRELSAIICTRAEGMRRYVEVVPRQM